MNKIEEKEALSGYIKKNQDNIEIKTIGEYPFEDTSTLRWIIAIILLFSGFIIESFVETVPLALAIITTFILPIASMFIIDKRPIKKLFRIPSIKDLKTILRTLIQLFIAVIILSIIANELNIAKDFAENPIGENITKDNIKILLPLMVFQLIFEELVFVIPFLFIYHKASPNKKLSFVLALIISSEIFGAAHLSTYNYNLVQTLVLIAVIRFILSCSYIKSKNLTVSYLVHLIYDFILLALVYAANSVNI